MKEIQPAVTFDLWHTLVYVTPDEEQRYMQRQLDVARDALEGSPPLSGARTPSGAELRALFRREYEAAVAESRTGRSVTPVQQFERAARRARRRPRTRSYLSALRDLVRTLRFHVAPDARGTLSALRREGYLLAILSNTTGEPGRYLRPALSRLGFDELVSGYTFSDELPWSKPAPQIFRHALDRIGSGPAAAVHVGDSWSDVEGGRRARMAGTILFTGLQNYGQEYRRLFFPAGLDRLPAQFRVRTLAGAIPIVRRLVPPPRR